MSARSIEDKPPSLAEGFTPPKPRNLPRDRTPWGDVKLPIDIMLLTVKDCEFLSCYKLLKNSFKSYTLALGDVYFGGIGINEPLKVALMKCQEGSNTTGGSTIVVKNAVTILKPKAVFAVGCCSGLQRCETRLGDVVVCSKMTQYASRIVQSGEVQSTGATRVPVSRNMLQLIKDAAAGWKPPLRDPSSREIEVHCDAEYLSGPEFVCDKQKYDELIRLYPDAKAIDREGEGQICVLKQLSYLTPRIEIAVLIETDPKFFFREVNRNITQSDCRCHCKFGPHLPPPEHIPTSGYGKD